MYARVIARRFLCVLEFATLMNAYEKVSRTPNVLARMVCTKWFTKKTDRKK